MSQDNQLRVLLIEDNAGDAVLVEDYLHDASQGKFLLRHAQTLAQGQNYLNEFRPQVVLLDLNLPDSKGLETLKRFYQYQQSQDQQPSVLSPAPIVVLTSFDDEEMAQKALTLGAHDYLIKQDINARLLRRSILLAIQRHGTQLLNLLTQTPNQIQASRHAMDTLERINRSTPDLAVMPVQPPTAAGTSDDDQLIFGHLATGHKAAEVLISGLEYRLNKLEVANRDHTLAEARRELLWVQLERLVLGNGKGPLLVRIETLERALKEQVERNLEYRHHRIQWLVAFVVLTISWVGSLIAWLINSFAKSH